MGQIDGMSIAQIINTHPSLSPHHAEIGPYLLDPPFCWEPDHELSRFRDEIQETLLKQFPEDRYLRDLVNCFNEALNWRRCLPQELQSWRTHGLLAAFREESRRTGPDPADSGQD